jgi:hypothetical protein
MAATPLPNNEVCLLVAPSSTLSQARSVQATASQAHVRAKELWGKRIMFAQNTIAGVLFIKWLWPHSLVAAAIMAALTWIALCFLHVFNGLLFTRGEKKRRVDAERKLVDARQNEVKRYLADMKRGRYQWIRRGGDYLAVLPDAGLLYYFGSISKDQHVLLDPHRAVLDVRVATECHISSSTTSTTTQGRRMVLMPNGYVGMIGKGKSTTSTATHTSITTTYALEIQIQLELGEQPFWIVLPFGFDGKDADNWKVLVTQLR